MDFVFQILRLIVIYLIFKKMLWLFVLMVQRSTKSSSIQEDSIAEREITNNAFIVKPTETVITHCCEKVLNKEKAFQLVTKDGTTHYFCSWDCREDYLKGNA